MASHRSGFWERFAGANPDLSSFLGSELRRFADTLKAVGPPVLAFPLLFNLKGVLTVGQITVPDSSEPLTATVTFKDEKGYDTQPAGVPTWSSSDESVATVEASEDGLTATVTVGAPGATVIECRDTEADGDVVSQGTVTVQPGAAAIGDVEFQAAPA
jgi:hypothetical protein